MIEQVRRELQVSERRVRGARAASLDEQRLTADIVEFARQCGRYGYRKIAELLRTTAD